MKRFSSSTSSSASKGIPPRAFTLIETIIMLGVLGIFTMVVIGIGRHALQGDSKHATKEVRHITTSHGVQTGNTTDEKKQPSEDDLTTKVLQ